MPVFGYQGTGTDGKRLRGSIHAESARAGRDSLRQQGVTVTAIRPIDESAQRSWLQYVRQHRARAQWAVAAHELSMLLRTGMGIDEAVATLADQYRGGLRIALRRIHDDVTAGRSLAESMAMQPHVFDAASVRLAEVGENAGNLDAVLDELAQLKQRMAEFGDKVATALMYPMFLLTFGVAAMIFLMTWVLPPLLENLQETLTQIPWPTRIAQSISTFLVNNGLMLLVASGALLVIGVWILSTERGRTWIDRQVLKLPVIGPILIKQNVARIAMVLGMLLRSGIPLRESMQLAARSTRNTSLRRTLAKCVDDLSAGGDVAAALQDQGLFPPLAIRVFAVGQESGELDQMLIRLADDYNQQVQRATSRLTTMLEPTLILFMAVLVGFLLVATMLPILQAGQVT
ncbi:type II secretion system F family protein [Crateriforma conspicua]|uniref:General secretion pathway protein F n=1 Tax=Crateriforma conspicua TaxID=2527996 RepID=A0A5C5YA56_9PLAN|nr:type II secretion system F family protein [Crateriforma conspicua]TWT72014.1 Type II secretion system protein F [Crateriforma conspicua]